MIKGNAHFTPAIVGLFLALAGCTVGPNYHPPAVNVPAAYGEKAKVVDATAATADLAHWWQVFHDPELDSLITRATQGNRDLKQALSRVRQARAQRGVIAANLGPEVDAMGSYTRSVSSHNGPGATGSAGASSPSAGANGSSGSSGSSNSGGATGGTSSGAGSAGTSGGAPGTTNNLYQVGFDALWEIDIFGGTRRAVEAADYGIGAAEEGRRTVLVSLLAEVATTYLELRSEQRQLAIARQNLQAQRETLSITDAKLKSGFATDLDLSRQAAEVALTAATIPSLESAERDAMHTLAFLIGVEPTALEPELTTLSDLPPTPPEIPVGVPSDLLRRRPDIRQAERQIAVATAEIGVATADLFPKFDLTAAFGLSSTTAKHLTDWPSRFLTVSPAASWPILDWGRVRSEIRIQNELQQQAVLGYENTVALALKDVEGALVHYQNEQVRRLALNDAVNASRRSYELARDQYAHGLVDQLAILDAQRQLLSAESALAQSDGTVRTNIVALYKALGGGWEL